MSDRKKDILEAARHLFNRSGYAQVTVRMIALELKISSGNLNYHFKKREDILEALYFEMVSEFDNRIEQLEKQVFSLAKIKEDIKESMHRMYHYRFIWTDLHNLLSLNPNINAHFMAVYKKRTEAYKYLFDQLIESNLLKPFLFEKERLFLIDRMIGFSNTFLYASALYGKKKTTQDFMEEQSNVLLAIMHPYLTDLGKKEFKILLPEYFE